MLNSYPVCVSDFPAGTDFMDRRMFFDFLLHVDDCHMYVFLFIVITLSKKLSACQPSV